MDAPKPTIPDLDQLERELTDASAEHDDGRRYVRASVAARIIGIGPPLGVYWRKRGLISALKIKVPSQPGAVRGEVVAWRLEDAVKQARQYWSGRRRWTQSDDDYLLDRLGLQPIEQLAADMGRSVKGLRMRAAQLGISQVTAQGEWTTGQLARLLGIPYNRVVGWCSRKRAGLKHRRLCDGQRTRLISGDQLRLFLKMNPQAVEGLSPIARARVGRLTMSVHQRRKAVAA